MSLVSEAEKNLKAVKWRAQCNASFWNGNPMITPETLPNDLEKIREAEEYVADAKLGQRRFVRGDNVLHVIQYLVVRKRPPEAKKR